MNTAFGCAFMVLAVIMAGLASFGFVCFINNEYLPKYVSMPFGVMGIVGGILSICSVIYNFFTDPNTRK